MDHAGYDARGGADRTGSDATTRIPHRGQHRAWQVSSAWPQAHVGSAATAARTLDGQVGVVG